MRSPEAVYSGRYRALVCALLVVSDSSNREVATIAVLATIAATALVLTRIVFSPANFDSLSSWTSQEIAGLMLAGASPIAMTFSVLMDFERSRSTREWF